MNRKTFTMGVVLTALLFLSVRRSLGIDAIAKDAQNSRWHVSETSLMATFLGGDRAEAAVMILDKQKVVGQTLTIETDGTDLYLQSADSPHVGFQLTTGKDNASSNKLKLVGGDQPTLFFNDKEQVQQAGKWIQVLDTSDKTIRLEIASVNFCRVKFEPAPDAKVPAHVDPKPVERVITAGDKELLHNVTASQLAAMSFAFSEGVAKKCTGCNGTGKVSVKVQTGTQQQGIYSVPVFANQEQQCPKCKGAGIERARDDVLIRLSGGMVKDLAQLKPDDPKKQDTLTKTYKTISDKMIGDEKTWVLLTANGKSILAQSNPEIGSAVVSLVEVKKSIKMPNDQRRYLVRVIGTDKEVFVDDPVLADELKGGHALMGGIVAPPADKDSDGHTTTLHGGFLIAPTVDRSMWWWYKDK